MKNKGILVKPNNNEFIAIIDDVDVPPQPIIDLPLLTSFTSVHAVPL